MCAYGRSQYESIEANQFDDITALDCEYVILIRERDDLAKDGLRLEFADNGLASIYRYRKLLEPP